MKLTPNPPHHFQLFLALDTLGDELGVDFVGEGLERLDQLLFDEAGVDIADETHVEFHIVRAARCTILSSPGIALPPCRRWRRDTGGP